MYGIIKMRNRNRSTVMKMIIYKWFVEHVISDAMDEDLGRFLSGNQVVQADPV
jgi:hypothetical protein